MEISAEKTKSMQRPVASTQKINGHRLETVTSFKYLGLVITDEGSKPKILSRIAQTTGALRSLVTSIFLHA